jgi:hypothetical protein
MISAGTAPSAPDHLVIDVENEENRDHGERQHLADGEHELPAIAHHLELPLGHRFHDVSVAGRDVAAERHTEQEADDDQPGHVRNERLRQRKHDEQDHGRQEHHAAADLVGEPAADQCADHCAALRAGRGKAEHQRIGIVLLADEHEHEGDRIEIPGFDQDRGHHQPADAAALGTVILDEIADSVVDRGLLRQGIICRYCCHAGSVMISGERQRLDAAIEQARIDAGFHLLEHPVHEID